MFIEIILAIMAATLIALAVILIVISFRSKKAIQLIQIDVHHVSQEATRALSTINEFIRTDLHTILEEANEAITNINALSSDIKSKMNSINFLFGPLKFLNSKLGPALSCDNESSSRYGMVPQILKLIVSSLFLIKTTKEFIKHEKRRS